MKSKLKRISAAQRTAIQALVDEAALASLIGQLGCAADAAQARSVVKRALAA